MHARLFQDGGQSLKLLALGSRKQQEAGSRKQQEAGSSSRKLASRRRASHCAKHSLTFRLQNADNAPLFALTGAL